MYCAAVEERIAGKRDESAFQLDFAVAAMRVRSDVTGASGLGLKNLMSGLLELSDDPTNE